MSNKNLYNRMALGLGALTLAGCSTLSQPDTNTCMQVTNVNALLVGFGGTKYNRSCNDGRMAFALMQRENDPVGNALGFLLYLDQNPEAQKMLESRLGGREGVKLKSETVAGFLLADDDISRSIGAQIYMASDDKSRADINNVLIQNNADPRTLIPASLSKDVQNVTAQWAQNHASAPQGVSALTTFNKSNLLKQKTSDGVSFTFRKEKPAAAPVKP